MGLLKYEGKARMDHAMDVFMTYPNFTGSTPVSLTKNK